MVRVEAAARLYIDDTDFENVARLGAAHRDGAGADMDAEPFSGTAPVDRGVHRTGAAAVDVLFVLGPQVHAFGAGIPFDHPVVIVIRVVGQRFDRDVIAGIDLDQRL